MCTVRCIAWQDGGVYPSMHWAGLCIPAFTGHGGVCPGGVCPGGVCRGGCLPGEVSEQGGCVSQYALGSPPVNIMHDRHLWKHYLAATSLQMVTRMHFSRIPTARLLTVSRSIPYTSGGGGLSNNPGCRPPPPGRRPHHMQTPLVMLLVMHAGKALLLPL